MMEVRLRDFGHESYRPDEERRPAGRYREWWAKGAFGHEVSQRGGGRGGDGDRGHRPISTMEPPHTGHRSMR